MAALLASSRASQYAFVSSLALVLLLIYGYHWYAASGQLLFIHPAPVENGEHPILRLHRQALQDHATFVARQSKSFDEAVAAYKARYRMDPPPSFDQWVAKALDNRSPLIDNFDHIVTQTSAFSGHPLNGSAPDSNLFEQRLMRVCIRDHEVVLEGFVEDWFQSTLQSMLDEFAGSLNDVCVYLNTLDEPRQILFAYGNLATDDAMASHHREGVTFFSTTSHGSMFTEATLPCLLADRAPDRATELRQHHHMKSVFADDFYEITDLCNYNRSLAFGFINAPETASFTHDPVPILSNAKLSTFGDILIPSVWRFEHGQGHQEFFPDSREWSSKSKTLYWRGSTTGGHFIAGRQMHRQQLVKKIHELVQAEEAVKPDVGFTNVIQCDDAACNAEKATLPMKDRESLDAAWSHKYLLDVDGNGLSGRLYDLLGSNSVVLRHTMLREWHDERLWPWLHYVPLRPGAPEIQELLDFFGTPQGNKVAYTIAKESREWTRKSLRPIDQQLYLWRVLLELIAPPRSNIVA